MDVDSLAITVDIARFMLHFLNEASVCHLGGSMQPRMGLTARWLGKWVYHLLCPNQRTEGGHLWLITDYYTCNSNRYLFSKALMVLYLNFLQIIELCNRKYSWLKFLSRFYFFGIIGIIIRVHGLKGKFDQNNLKESEKDVKSLKLEKSGPPKLVCKHFTNLYLH